MVRRPAVAVLAILLMLFASLAAAGSGGNGHQDANDNDDQDAGDGISDNERAENSGHTSRTHHATIQLSSDEGAHGKLAGRLTANSDRSSAIITATGPFGRAQPAVLDWEKAAINGDGTPATMLVKFHASDLGGGDWRCVAVDISFPELTADSDRLTLEVITIALSKVSDDGGKGTTKCEIHAGASGPQPAIAPRGNRTTPFGAFSFEVQINGTVYPFKSASGLKIEQAVVEIEEGGVNHNTTKLHAYKINSTKLQKVMITRCLTIANPDWQHWFEEKAGPNGPPVRPVVIRYFDKQGSPVMALHYADVAILDYQVDTTNENEVCETITLAPGGVQVA